MRTLTIILIASIFVVLGVLSAEAKKPVCTEKVSNTYCNPSVIVMPKAESAKSFEVVGGAGKALQLILKIQDWYSGNATEIRSPKPFHCNSRWNQYEANRGVDFSEYEEEALPAGMNEQPGYGDVPTPKGWYYCKIDMLGRGENIKLKSWDFQFRPSANRQFFVVEGYWVEED